MNKAIFLDRDGTINVETEYLHECDKLQFIPGSVEALAMMKGKGYLLIVVSNQSGVGRGFFSMEDVERVNGYMNELLEQKNAAIDAFYCCPHVEADHCTCRKPETGLYRKAAGDFDIDMKASFMVGDKITDILAAGQLGCGYGLVLSGHGIEEKYLRQHEGHYFNNLLEFARSL